MNNKSKNIYLNTELCIPFRPETWPTDDGEVPHFCTECGTPVRYGSMHSVCGHRLIKSIEANNE